MDYQSILFEVSDGVAVITFNRPEKYNAFTETMIAETIDAFKQCSRDASVRALLLTGAGKAFSSGQDLNEMGAIIAQDGTNAIAEHLRHSYNDLVTRIRTLDRPVIGAINGLAVGAGCSIALACDLRICADTSAFVFAGFANIGLIPDGGGTFFLPRLVGVAKAFELAILADSQNRVSAQAALELGLVAKIVPADQLLAEAAGLASKLAHMPTRAIGLTKRALNRSWTSTLEEALEYEAQLQGIAGSTEDFKEGVAAFLEKRSPTFKGT